MDYAHRQNVIHRDLRPGNVLVSEQGLVKVADFGTSRVLEIAAHGTTVIGSPPYMAPEQFHGKAVFASDIYSLGITMYQMLTGVLPYDTPSPAELAKLMTGELVSPPRVRNPKLPRAVNEIVMKALAPDISNRYQRAADLLADVLALGRDAGSRRPSRTPAGDAGSTATSAHMQEIHSATSRPRDAPGPLLLALPQADARPFGPVPVLRGKPVGLARGTTRAQARTVRSEGLICESGCHAEQIGAECHGDKSQGHVMSFGTGKIWMNGSLVDWADAKIHIASHVIHYGTGVFEGARCYSTPKGSACFRLDSHVVRLLDSAKIYRMDSPLDKAGWENAILETIRENQAKACYIRPLMYRGYNQLGVNPLPCPVDAAVLVWEWGAYLGPDALEKGVDVRVSSWNRTAPNTFPAAAKATANYANSVLIKMEAMLDGYAEGIALDVSGYVCEGSGQNLFLVRNNVIVTPPASSSILGGITRDCVITIARGLGYDVREEVIPREMLYLADEAFFCGTAVEVTPIRTIDKMTIGSGNRPVTEAIRQTFFDILNGELPDSHGWLTYVYPRKPTCAKTARPPPLAGSRNRQTS